MKLVRQTYREKSWSCQKAEAWLVAPDERKLADYREVAVSIADGSRSAAVEAELVDVGAGDSAADYQGREVKGKVVLGSAGAGALHREAVLKRGALGVISYATNRPEVVDAPDQVAWQAIDAEAKGIDGVKDGTPGTFGFSISPRRGRALSREMKGADKPFKVKIQVEAGAPEKGEQAMVEGWIKGTEISDQQIVLTAHIQEEMTSANDDGSGCGNLLEIGRALTRLIKEGKLPQAQARPPVLVGERVLERGAVLPREPQGAAQDAPEPQPGHGGRRARAGEAACSTPRACPGACPTPSTT